MKKILTIILTFALVALCVFTGCMEYKPPASTEKPGSSDEPADPDKPADPTENDGEYFTVTLYYLGEPYSPADKIYAQWSDGMSVTRAEFGADGVAKTNELDGDYVVTLSAAPEGFTYEPNDYYATNDSKNTAITLYKINEFANQKDGSDFFNNIIVLPSTGAYRVTFDKPDQIIYFSITPRNNGVYVFQSLIDVTANEVNPVLYRYPSPQLDSLYEKYDGGGAENTYTKNFKYTIYLDNSYVGNDFKFSIQAQSIKKEAFPIVIDFLLERDGEYSDNSNNLEKVMPEEDFIVVPEIEGTFKLAAKYNGNVQDDSLFELGDDGYYHVKATGETLYAQITSFNEILGGTLTTGDIVGRLKYYGKSYIDFIKSYAGYLYDEDGNPIYERDENGGLVYVPNEDGNLVPSQASTQRVNSDGVYPVTQELKEFLQIHSIAMGYFRDGKGVAETGGFNSGEDDQWLWACGYYS